jgi:hypothetical protein
MLEETYDLYLRDLRLQAALAFTFVPLVASKSGRISASNYSLVTVGSSL